MDAGELLRSLPSVDQVLARLSGVEGLPRQLVVDEIRRVLAERRDQILRGGLVADGSIEVAVQSRLRDLLRPSLRRVINATGVVLHTNLGRAPLTRFQPVSGYSNLEYDLADGKRGSRETHTARLWQRLLDRPAIVVNNNAAAVYLVLNELAAGEEVIVSRGELIEIGDGFRIPDIMMRSGAVLREVGTTNRTILNDYRAAITSRTRLILRVHPSNFHISGFTARPDVEELAELGREHRVPVYEDLGSGCLIDLKPYGIDEPVVADSLRAGVNIVSFSCDKLLGGPQSGIIAGDAELVQRVRRNPMYRAFRVDKLVTEALETTLLHLLKHEWHCLPTLSRMFATVEDLRMRAERVAEQIQPVRAHVRLSESPVGGGSTPDQTLPTCLLEITAESAVLFEKKLRSAPVPVICRIEKDRVVLDMRTVSDDDEQDLVAAVQFAVLI